MLLVHDVTEGEVIVTSFTFQRTANVVVAGDAAPVFADIERDSLALSAGSIRDVVSEETSAIISPHFAGDIAAEIR